MSNNLVKLLDFSLLPFAITILAKALGLYLVLQTYGIDWGISEFPNSLINVTPLVYGKDLTVVATYSNLILFGVVFVAFSLQVLLSNLRQNAKQNMSLLRKLMQMPRLNLFQQGVHMYTKLYVWLMYVWLVAIYIIIDTALGRTQPWLAAVSTILTIGITAIVLADTAKEIENLKKNVGRLQIA